MWSECVQFCTKFQRHQHCQIIIYNNGADHMYKTLETDTESRIKDTSVEMLQRDLLDRISLSHG